MKSLLGCLLILSAMLLTACDSSQVPAQKGEPEYIRDTGIKADGYIQVGGTLNAR